MRPNQVGGHAAIALLEAYGVDTVFGIPGVHTLELYRGLADRKMRHIGVRHEQGAGFMADGYARASGRPGVCCLITGPGLMNAATPVGQAYSDSVPVLVLASVNDSADLGKGRGRLHEISDQHAAIEPLTGLTRTIRSAAELPEAMEEAFTLFETRRARPAVLNLTLDMLRAPATLTDERRARRARPLAAEADIAEAAKLIDAAERPMVIFGGGCVDCADEARGFLPKSGAIAVTTTAGKGVIADSDPATLSSSLQSKATQEALADADLVIAIGTELAETDHWSNSLTFHGKLIRVDLDAHTLTRDYTPAVGILADAGPTLAALTGRIRAGRRPDSARVAQIRAANETDIQPLERKHIAVLDAVRAALPADGQVFTDMTQIAYTANFYFPCERPRRWFHPLGFGTLGYAVPAAIGGKIACPDRPTIAIVGDGGFLFTMQELGTAVELGLPLPILVWNNDAFGQIAYGMNCRDIPELGVRQRNPDYLALARAFGAEAVRPDSLPALQNAISAAFSAEGPTLIEIREDAPFLS
ncbi:MAG TPA: 5-guanidino-2-oxopentanoate decarboxylase [Dongiaceae bacterium]|jgi:thiamine pyrophosphate-dependent acetolactate synthase large subunit-like protein|nr:5-guanidino-2-oxopentanoate decarboxylase [Dongiaceae bacterium]